MSLLCKEESKIIRAFLEIPIPEYIREYSDGGIDLMDCYEVGFMFANDLLRDIKINPNISPWGDGKSVIFDSRYTELLLAIERKLKNKNEFALCLV